MKKISLFFAIALCCLHTTKAQNLILNPSCDDSLIGGNIPHWQEVIATTWSQRCSGPNALSGNGSCYFFAGANALAELKQELDVSSFSASIDNGTHVFYFHGYETSFGQSPTDEANIYIDFKDSIDTLISTIHFGPFTQTTVWQELDSTLQVPVSTRKAVIRLKSVRHNGSNNDGYYDELYLGTTPLTSVYQNDNKPEINIYPNPTSGEFNVFMEEISIINPLLTICNLLGGKIFETSLSEGDNTIRLSIANGIYFATITTTKERYTKKIIIQR